MIRDDDDDDAEGRDPAALRRRSYSTAIRRTTLNSHYTDFFFFNFGQAPKLDLRLCVVASGWVAGLPAGSRPRSIVALTGWLSSGPLTCGQVVKKGATQRPRGSDYTPGNPDRAGQDGRRPGRSYGEKNV